MIPRVAKLGYGFAGAGLYYLNDKRPEAEDSARPSAEDYYLADKGGAQTSERVGFTETRNLPTRDPAKALRCMAWLAANARNVRQAAVAAAAKAAGMRYDDYVRATNPYRGNTGKKPLYALSIAWHPTRNKKPTRQQMVAAADEVLQVLGLQDRQALIIEHTDTAHPHVHLIVNRVSPETGKYARLGNDWLSLSRWALAYEKRTGQVLCFERVENWKRRDGAREDKARRRQDDPAAKGQYVIGRDVPRRDHDWFRSVAHLKPDEIRAARSARQEREREKLRLALNDRALRLEGRLTRQYGVKLADIEVEIKRLQRAEYWRKVRDRHPVALLLSPRHAFHALVDLATARKHLRPRRIVRLQNAATDLRTVLAKARRTAGADADLFRQRLQQRHVAELKRDEDRIAALAKARRARGSGERTRAVFNLRGAIETARFLAPKQAALRLTDLHTRIVDAAKAGELSAKSVLTRLVRSLGGAANQNDLRARTLSGWPENVRLANAKAPRDPPRDSRPRRSSDVPEPEVGVQVDRPPPADEDAIRFARRRDERLARIEQDQARAKRRRRKRPRGRTRAMD